MSLGIFVVAPFDGAEGMFDQIDRRTRFRLGSFSIETKSFGTCAQRTERRPRVRC